MTGLADLNVAYAAGIVDSRGHIELVARRGIGTPRIRVTTARIDIVEWLARNTGTTVRRDERGYDRRGCSEHCSDRHQHIARQSAYWNVDAARAVIVLFNVLPYMVCSTVTATDALAQAQAGWPKRPRTEISEAMARLGWAVPGKVDLPVLRERKAS